MPKVRKIEPTINPLTHLPEFSAAKRRTAAYARVSTDSDEQFTSYEAQVNYYTKLIKNNPQWEFVKVYSDEGISGLNTKRREGFNEMIKDAFAGKIDLILTKSISRFARNTVDTLVTVRNLKDRGIEVYFEKENIYTLDGNGELLITIMSSIAQEESHSISENVTWAKRKQFEEGKVIFQYKNFLGYDKGPDGKPIVNDAQAKIVRDIYRAFILGQSVSRICRMLEKDGVKSPSGKVKWSDSTVFNILRNEKYKGDALLQKKFTINYLEKKLKKNEGEVAQYYVEGNHPPIISPEEFDLAQAEIRRRAKLGRKYSGVSVFSSKIVCGDCGEFYGSKTWHSTDKYHKTIWQCNNKFNGKKCSTPHIDENRIKQGFISALNTLLSIKEQVISNCNTLIAMLEDTHELDEKIQNIEIELTSISALVSDLVNKNSSEALSQKSYQKRYAALTEEYENLTKSYESLKNTKQDKEFRIDEIRTYTNRLQSFEGILTEWDDMIWTVLTEKVTVSADGSMIFTFKDGTEIPIH